MPVVGEAAKERHDSPGTLRVQARRRLVKEEEQLGLRGQLDTNRRPLAMLHAQGPDNRVSMAFETAHLQTLLHAVIPVSQTTRVLSVGLLTMLPSQQEVRMPVDEAWQRTREPHGRNWSVRACPSAVHNPYKVCYYMLDICIVNELTSEPGNREGADVR